MMPYLLAAGGGSEGDPIGSALRHALDHVYHGAKVPISKFAVMAFLVAAVILALAAAIDRKSLVPKGTIRNLFESILLFIRNELVRPTMGAHHGDRFVPFFATLFTTILFMNFLGLVPIPGIGGTVTSSFMATGALAAIVLLVGLISGIVLHGVGGFLHTFVPPGLPVVLVPLLFVLEVVGYFIKHGVLMIRLFANMIAGHLVVGAFLGLIFVAKSYAIAVPLVGMSLFISLLELLVCFLQAYVFTLLSVLFVGSVVHPEH